jgi:hypothetical protein
VTRSRWTSPLSAVSFAPQTVALGAVGGAYAALVLSPFHGAGFTVRHRLYAIQSLFTGTIATSIRAYMEAAGFAIEEIIERDPYSPEVEHQSRRAYIFARKPSSAAQPS